MTEAAIPYVEALAALREEAVRNGHEMAPAMKVFDALFSACTRCDGGCAVYGPEGSIRLLRQSIDKPCEQTR